MRDDTALSEPEPVGRWCLVANVLDEREWGPDHEARPGAKHFPAGAKVYCDLPLGFWQWDDEFGKLRVLGHHRGSRRLVSMIVKAQWLHNFRVKCEYSPQVRLLLDGRHGFRMGGYAEADRDEAGRHAAMANSMTALVQAKRQARTVAA